MSHPPSEIPIDDLMKNLLALALALALIIGSKFCRVHIH